MFNARAIIHSLSTSGADTIEDFVTIMHENGNNDVIAEYKGIRYTAIFNPFVCRYYVDDIYGKLQNQSTCLHCGAKLPNENC